MLILDLVPMFTSLNWVDRRLVPISYSSDSTISDMCDPNDCRTTYRMGILCNALVVMAPQPGVLMLHRASGTSLS